MSSDRTEPRPQAGPAAPDTAGVAARPPLVYLVAILLGWGLHRLWPAPLFGGALAPAGAGLVVLAVVLFGLSVRAFVRAGTPVPTSRPTTALVTTGPYRLSRNPIYLAFTVLQVGVGIWIDTAWILVTLLPTVVVITYGVIAREERYLERKLGEGYLRYRERVRRWI